MKLSRLLPVLMGGGAARSPLLTGLVAYWTLDESSDGSGAVTRSDSVGANHLTDNATTASAVGKVSNGADFEAGDSTYLSIADNADLSTGNIDYTFALWVKLETRAANKALLGKWGGAGHSEYVIWTDDAQKFALIHSTNGTTLVQCPALTFGLPAAGTWYLIVAWHDATANTLSIQVNNGTVDSVACTGGFDSDAQFCIGRYSTTGYIDGVIDEVGFWKRVLSDAERTLLYNGGDGITYPFNVSVTDPLYVRINPPQTTGSQSVMILEPGSYVPGEPIPLVIYHHGMTEDHEALLDDALKADVVSALLSAGYLLAGSNAHGDNWGNPASLTDYENLFTLLDGRYDISRVIHFSQSMGGNSGLLSLAAGLGGVKSKGWFGIYPVCSLADMFDGNTGDYSESIRTAFGIAVDGSDYAALTSGYDPVLLAASAFSGFRMRFYASAADSVVSKTANSDAMATLVTGEATECEVVVCTGTHGDPTHFQPSDVVAFCDRCV